MNQSPGAVYLRAATADDQRTIRRIVTAAGLNPVHLDWPNFLVAEAVDGVAHGNAPHIVGVGQIKPHGDGSRELASIAVLEAYQRRGIAALIIQTLLAREAGDVYLYCGDTMPAYYTRFGFVEVDAEALPRSVRRWFRFGRAAVRLVSLLGEEHTLHAMRIQQQAESGNKQ